MNYLKPILKCGLLSILLSLGGPFIGESHGAALTIDGKSINSSIKKSVLMAPGKEVAEAFAGKFSFNSTDMSAIIQVGDQEIKFRLDNAKPAVNGKYAQAPAPLMISENRFVVPVEFISNQLGAVVENKNSNVDIYYKLSKPTESSQENTWHTVQSGDTLWLLSLQYGTTIAKLKEWNQLSSDMLLIGQRIVVGVSASKTPAETTAKTKVMAVTTNSATLFSGAGFQFSSLRYFQKGTSLEVAGKIGDWYKVKDSKGEGFVYRTVLAVQQDLIDNEPTSSFFSQNIPYDTTGDARGNNTYIVVSGDTLWTVAQKNSITMNELLNANGMNSSSLIYPGQTLNIPSLVIGQKDQIPGYGEVLDWFSQAQYLFPLGAKGKVTDLLTNKSFMIERTIGANHADIEPLTALDGSIMKEIYKNWSWDERPCILEVNGRKLAVSLSGMPHAGVDGAAFLQNVDNRSGGYGLGPNYDKITNGIDGHFDLFFLNSLGHSNGKINPRHQLNVLIAGGLQ